MPMNHNTYPSSNPEREATTELSDGDRMDFHQSDLAPVLHNEPETTTPPREVDRTPEVLPHHIPRQITDGVIRLRVIRKREAMGDTASTPWDTFEEVTHGKRV